MPKDGLIRLPDHIVAPLLRALMHIRHTPQSRLTLHQATTGRAPSWDQSSDFDVMWRGEKVARVWRHTYVRENFEEHPWHWDITAPRRKHEWGHSLTLHEALEQLRMAWDRLKPEEDSGVA
jgi:hypothetical protein